MTVIGAMNFRQSPNASMVLSPGQESIRPATSPMANRNEKNPGSVLGPFYVDNTCCDCGLCPAAAPTVFRRDDELGMSIVFHQPATAAELAQARDALSDCPTDSIGEEEDSFDRAHRPQ